MIQPDADSILLELLACKRLKNQQYNGLWAGWRDKQFHAEYLERHAAAWAAAIDWEARRG